MTKLPTAPAWFRHLVDGVPHLGGFDPESQACLDLGPADELDLLGAGQLDLADLRERLAGGTRIEFGSIHWQTPLRRASKILCLGKNFAAHAAEFGHEVPEEPVFFTKLPDTLLPHGHAIRLPHWLDTRVDHELELGVILGFVDLEQQGRKYVQPGEAMDLVAGWTILNDVTARRIQGDDRGKQRPWLRCKSFDSFCPLGPFVVPRDGLDIRDLQMDLWVNDDHRQHSRTSNMVVDVPTAIAYLSRHCTLRPGDLIAMGTPEGVGRIVEGDQITAVIEGLGTQLNPVTREPDPS